MKRIEWTDLEEKLLIEMRKDGLLVRDIAPHIGKTTAQCFTKLRSLGKKKNQKTWTRAEIETLTQMTTDGFLAVDVSKEINKTRNQVINKKVNMGFTVSGEKVYRMEPELIVIPKAKEPDDFWKMLMKDKTFENAAVYQAPVVLKPSLAMFV